MLMGEYGRTETTLMIILDGLTTIIASTEVGTPTSETAVAMTVSMTATIIGGGGVMVGTKAERRIGSSMGIYVV